MTKNRAIVRAIAAIPDTAWTPVRYPGAVRDPDTAMWISDAESAESALYRLRRHHRPDHRPAGGASGQRRPLPRRAVPGLALPPVLHQLDPAHRRGRHRPPPPRDHRNRVRRPDRRTPGPPALRALRRQLRLGAVRRDRPQPAPHRRHPRLRTRHRKDYSRTPRPRPRRDPAPTTDHRARPTRPTRPSTRPPLTQPLALGTGMAPTVEPHHRA